VKESSSFQAQPLMNLSILIRERREGGEREDYVTWRKEGARRPFPILASLGINF